MSKIKTIEEFTLREYEEYKEELNSVDFNIFNLMNMFGYENAEDMELNEFNNVSKEVITGNIIAKPIKTEYNIKGRLFKPVLMINEIKAAQFIDYQSFMSNYKMHQVLSIFLLPIYFEKGGLFNKNKKLVRKYNDGYDLKEVQEYIYDNFTIGEAYSLSSFFLNLCYKLLPVIQNSLAVTVTKEMLKLRRQVKKKSH